MIKNETDLTGESDQTHPENKPPWDNVLLGQGSRKNILFVIFSYEVISVITLA